MRQIKFRAKRMDSNEWLFGSLFVDKKGQCYIKEPNGKLYFIEDKDTIGQFTGLKDKNGKDIYEGDIVKHPYIDPIFRVLVEGKNGDGVASEIVFHDGAFVVKHDIDDFIYLDAFVRKNKVEVIGNIIDNPELLKK